MLMMEKNIKRKNIKESEEENAEDKSGYVWEEKEKGKIIIKITKKEYCQDENQHLKETRCD